MKVVYIENPLQDEYTMSPQLIDGKILYWTARSIKTTQTFQEFLSSIKECYDNVEYVLIHNIIPCDRYLCDQGCKPGYGCKQEYKEDNHAIFIKYALILK